MKPASADAAVLRWGLTSRRAALRTSQLRSDESLFSELYAQHSPALDRYIRSILRDSCEVEDVRQTVMLKAFSALRTETREFELRPWLFRIAHNEAISRARAQRPTDELDESTLAPTGSLSDMVADRVQLTQLWVDLGELAERQRQALVLRELNGLSHEEIAEVLEVSSRSVKQTIFEARVALGEFAEGRAMQCAEVQRVVSDGDGRVRRGRRMRAHLRDCACCRGFDLALSRRPAQLAALAPILPMASGAALFGSLFPGSKVAASVATSAGATGGATGSLGTALMIKAAIAVSSVAAVGAGSAALVDVGAGRASTLPARSTTASPRAVPGNVSLQTPTTTGALRRPLGSGARPVDDRSRPTGPQSGDRAASAAGDPARAATAAADQQIQQPAASRPSLAGQTTVPASAPGSASSPQPGSARERTPSTATGAMDKTPSAPPAAPIAPPGSGEQARGPAREPGPHAAEPTTPVPPAPPRDRQLEPSAVDALHADAPAGADTANGAPPLAALHGR